MTAQEPTRGRRSRRNRSEGPQEPLRKVDYHNLRNPFPQMKVFSDDQIGDMHESALKILEDMGMRVLLPEAREIYAKGGAKVDGEMVWIGRDMVEAAIASAPKAIRGMGGAGRGRVVILSLIHI